MKTALIVDDSRVTRLALRRVLASLGFQCSEAADAGSGLACLAPAEEPPDLVLVDWNMPGMSGLDLIRAVRAESRLRAVRLIMVTSETDPLAVVRALNAGADEYVMKPFSTEELVEKLAIVGVAAS